MSSIPERVKIISRDIQCTFEELIKLLVRKTLRPALNPLNSNTKIVYNNIRNRYERGYVGNSADDNVSKYNYILTNDCLGWCDEILVNFKVVAKFIKNNINHKTTSCNSGPASRLKAKSRVAFSDKEGEYQLLSNSVPSFSQYKNFLSFFASRSMQSIIANKKSNFSYASDIPYTHSFKQLENIGKDIIEQTDPTIDPVVSAKMSTSMFRAKLHNLETELSNLSVDHPQIYDAYIEMVRLINSLPRNKINWIINLIAILTYQRWEDLPENQQLSFQNALGEQFISIFTSNELITILLQANLSEIILTSSYLFPLLKMLFIVFGYSKLVPIVVDRVNNNSISTPKHPKNIDKYQGAFKQRKNSVYKMSDELNNIVDNMEGMSSRPDPEPVDHLIYDFIKLFGELYPTIIGLMGGTEKFPPENIEVMFGDIPPGYPDLSSVPEYLWRFNDFSYCRFLEYGYSKQMINSLNAKINNKARNLHNLN